MSGAHIAYLGAILLDKIYSIDRLPRSGEGVVVHKSLARPGGCAYNSAAIARACGAHVDLLAPLGQGVVAKELECLLEQGDINIWRVESEEDNGSCLCLVEQSGERSMITVPGIERALSAQWYADVPNVRIASWDAVGVSGYELAGDSSFVLEGFLDRVRALNPSCSFWFAPGPSCTEVSLATYAHMAELGAFWHLNNLEAEAIYQLLEAEGLIEELLVSGKDLGLQNVWCDGAVEQADDMLVRSARLLCLFARQDIIITTGATGAYLISYCSGIPSVSFVPAQAVQVTDTIGAGDAHLGALMAAYVLNDRRAHRIKNQRSCEKDDVKTSGISVNQVEYAHAWAAQICQTEGSLPSRKRLEELSVILKNKGSY